MTKPIEQSNEKINNSLAVDDKTVFNLIPVFVINSKTSFKPIGRERKTIYILEAKSLFIIKYNKIK